MYDCEPISKESPEYRIFRVDNSKEDLAVCPDGPTAALIVKALIASGIIILPPK